MGFLQHSRFRPFLAKIIKLDSLQGIQWHFLDFLKSKPKPIFKPRSLTILLKFMPRLPAAMEKRATKRFPAEDVICGAHEVSHEALSLVPFLPLSSFFHSTARLPRLVFFSSSNWWQCWQIESITKYIEIGFKYVRRL